jgi:hypothetical protein
MSYVTLALGWAIPWLLGFAVLLAFGWPRRDPDASDERSGHAGLRLGYGYFVGVLLLTFWMRVLSKFGARFDWLTIAVPLLLATGACLGLAARRRVLSYSATRDAVAALWGPQFPRWRRIVWLLLLGWLGLRFALLAAEVAWQPLYPWDAWVQWATKARVWYELGHIVPFVRADAWFAGAAGAYFDASPNYPATVPLQQVWSSVALGRWDDSAMNWPWFLTLIALSLAIYGALRDSDVPPLGALIGAWLVASLPLLDVHVALAGYADLLMGAVYALAALALYRWTRHRDWRDAGIALLLALACPSIKIPGIVWALTLVPGIVVALLPRRGVKFVALAFGVAALTLLALGKSETVILGYRLNLAFEPSWGSLVKSYFFFANWHLLWYGAIALILFGGRRLVRPPLAPLTMIVAAGVAFLFAVFAFTNASAWVEDYTTVNRATLHLAPLLVCLGALLWNEMTMAVRTTAPAQATTVAGTPVVADA